jgi:hypothetical protein
MKQFEDYQMRERDIRWLIKDLFALLDHAKWADEAYEEMAMNRRKELEERAIAIGINPTEKNHA